jgi:hypothetical protein
MPGRQKRKGRNSLRAQAVFLSLFHCYKKMPQAEQFTKFIWLTTAEVQG